MSPAEAIDTQTWPGCTSSACEQDVGVLPHLRVADLAEIGARGGLTAHGPSALAGAPMRRTIPVLPSISTQSPSRSQRVSPGTDTIAGMPELARDDGRVREQAAALDEHAERGRETP